MKKALFKFYNKNVEFSFNENFNGNTPEAKSTGYSLNWNNRKKVNSVEFIAAALDVKPGQYVDKIEEVLSNWNNNTNFNTICDAFKYTGYSTYDLLD